MPTLRTLVLALFALTLVAACNGERKSSKDGAKPATKAETQEAPPNDSAGASDVASSPSEPASMKDPDGQPLLNPPSEVQRREGKVPSSDVLASIGSYGARPGTSWVFDASSDGGFFLVASSSVANASGGDVLRRIDLVGGVKEHDFNPDVEGVQGAFILVPPELRGEIPTKDIGGDGIFVGQICGIIPGPNNKVIALAGKTGFLLDPFAREPAFTPEVVFGFPYAFNACDGTYSKDWKKVFVVDVVQTGQSNAQKGIFVADVPAGPASVTASLFTVPKEYGFNTHSKNCFQALELFDDKLYLIEGTARFDANWDSGIHVVPLNEFGEPLFAKATLVRVENPIERAQGCTLNPDNTASALIVGAKGSPTLLVGGTKAIAGFDLSKDTPDKVDLDPGRPGTQPLELERFGQGNPVIRFSPDGTKAYAMPHCRSSVTKTEIGGGFGQTLEQRLAVFDLTSDTPLANANGVDAGYLQLMKDLASKLKPSYMPRFAMTFRDMAVGTRHIGIIGAGAAGASGLGAGSDVVIIDLAKETPMSFTTPTDPKRAHELSYGLHLGQGDAKIGEAELTSRAIVWIP